MSTIVVCCLIVLYNKPTYSSNPDDNNLFYASIYDMVTLLHTAFKIHEKAKLLQSHYDSKLEHLDEAIQQLQYVHANNKLNPVFLIKAVLNINRVLEKKRQYVKKIPNINDDLVKLTQEKKVNQLKIDGHIHSLFQLQDFYNFDAKKVSDGILKESPVNSSLSALDCYEIGTWALDRQDAYHAKLWLNEAKRRLISKSADQTILLEKVLLKLASVYSVYKDAEMANQYITEILKINPTNVAAQQFQVILRASSTFYNVFADRYAPEPAAYNWGGSSNDGALVQQLCQHKQPFIEGPIATFCYYHDVYAYYHVKVEVLSMIPLFSIIHEIITDTEILAFHRQAVLQNTGRLAMNHSTVINYKSNRLLEGFKEKLSLIAQPVVVSDQFLYAHFDIGEFHKLKQGPIKGNKDFPIIDEKGFLMMLFLNDVESGGHVVFPTLNISISPKKGNALIWDSQVKIAHTICPIYAGNCTVVHISGYFKAYYD